MDRPGNKLRVTIRTSRPGIIIGRKGAEIEKLKQDLAKKTKREVFIDIQEVHKPELDAQLVSESIALQLEKRVAFRRAMRKAVDSALRFGCKGIKVRVSGRLNGAEIARSEWYLQGQLPLHTLRADIDYGFARSPHHVRRDRRQVLDLQGRDSGRRPSARGLAATSRNRGAPRASCGDRRERGDRGGPAIAAPPPASGAAAGAAGPAMQAPPASCASGAQPRRRFCRRSAPPQPAGNRKCSRSAPPQTPQPKRRRPELPDAEPEEQRVRMETNAMLMPKKVKYRKQQRGRMTGKAWRGSTLAFGDFGLKAMRLRLDHRPAD